VTSNIFRNLLHKTPFVPFTVHVAEGTRSGWSIGISPPASAPFSRRRSPDHADRRTGPGRGNPRAEAGAERRHPAHNYQIKPIQDLADFVGDSLGLSYQAAETDAEVIAFCGVHFMGETAKILNPGKRVVIPDANAGCSLSDSCPPEQLAAFLQQHAEKNYYVIAYINCSAGVKALCDVICTSGNAVKIVNAAPKDRNILFVPDQNLGAWVMEQTGRPMELWRGTVTCTSSSPATASSARGRSIPAHRSSRIRSAPRRCACSPMRSARRRR
jgi:hypothetical protein